MKLLNGMHVSCKLIYFHSEEQTLGARVYSCGASYSRSWLSLMCSYSCWCTCGNLSTCSTQNRCCTSPSSVTAYWTSVTSSLQVMSKKHGTNVFKLVMSHTFERYVTGSSVSVACKVIPNWHVGAYKVLFTQ